MKDDKIAVRIEALEAANGGGVGWYEDKGAYHLYLLETEAPTARLKPAGTAMKSGSVLVTLSQWEAIDDMGGCVLPLDQALDHIAKNSIFWPWI